VDSGRELFGNARHNHIPQSNGFPSLAEFDNQQTVETMMVS